MNVYMIVYNTGDLETNYMGLHSAIKSHGNSIRILKSAWLVETDKSADELYDNVIGFLEKGTHLLVIEVTSEYQGELDKKACDWLKDKFETEPPVEEKKGWFRRLVFG